MCAPSVMITGALTVYFCVIVHSAYPLFYLFLYRVCGVKSIEFLDPMEPPYAHFETFSDTYVAFLVFIILICIAMKKDLTIFLRISSFGAICVSALIIFVITYGVIGMSETKYQFYAAPSYVDVESE